MHEMQTAIESMLRGWAVVYDPGTELCQGDDQIHGCSLPESNILRGSDGQRLLSSRRLGHLPLLSSPCVVQSTDAGKAMPVSFASGVVDL